MSNQFLALKFWQIIKIWLIANPEKVVSQAFINFEIWIIYLRCVFYGPPGKTLNWNDFNKIKQTKSMSNSMLLKKSIIIVT